MLFPPSSYRPPSLVAIQAKRALSCSLSFRLWLVPPLTRGLGRRAADAAWDGLPVLPSGHAPPVFNWWCLRCGTRRAGVRSRDVGLGCRLSPRRARSHGTGGVRLGCVALRLGMGVRYGTRLGAVCLLAPPKACAAAWFFAAAVGA